MPLLTDLKRDSYPPGHIVARTRDTEFTWADFVSAIHHMRKSLAGNEHSTYALFEPDTYHFAVALFALLAEGCRVYLPGENHAAMSAALQGEGARLIGDFGAADALRLEPMHAASAKPDDFTLSGELVVFTSGSSGKPKSIPKQLAQIDAELDVLERFFGGELENCTALGTVTHQHLYGLLFQLLWPLTSGRVFWHRPFVDPLLLAQQALRWPSSYWVMSPGHLHRLSGDMPWQELHSSVRRVFSSGGPLEWQAAHQVADGLGGFPVEILGSSETGGIAHRQQLQENETWQALPEVVLEQSAGGTLRVNSPFLPDNESYTTQDRVHFADDGRFTLLGRADRIVKLEGKRISLPEVEQTLQSHAWINEAHSARIRRKRDIIAALVTLTPEGASALQALGLVAFNRELRQSLANRLPALALPRALRINARLPRNSQGKLPADKVAALFATRSDPVVLSAENFDSNCNLQLWVDNSCPHFEGHFSQGPILPGVVQIKWAEALAREYLDLKGSFTGMQTLKFKEIIRPNTKLTLDIALDVNKDTEQQRLQFRFSSSTGEHSQGRLLYLAEQ